MKTRLQTLFTVLSIAATLGWITSRIPRAAAQPEASAPYVLPPGAIQERPPGSDVPCAVPLTWRVARVDPEFGLAMEEATTIVSEAAGLWEEGSGRRLFAHDPERGFPVRLVYDERQGVLADREARQRELDALGGRLEVERAEVTASAERAREDTEEHLARAAELERRVAEHNATIRELNRSGGLSDEQRRELETMGEVLQEEQARLAEDRERLREQQEAVRRAEADLNARSAEYVRLGDELTAAFPPSEVEAGEYREAVRREDGRVVSVSREIRIYRFANPDELRLVAAHELGHAMGLGHTDDDLGVMSSRARSDRTILELAGSDVALLQATCPS